MGVTAHTPQPSAWCIKLTLIYAWAHCFQLSRLAHVHTTPERLEQYTVFWGCCIMCFARYSSPKLHAPSRSMTATSNHVQGYNAVWRKHYLGSRVLKSIMAMGQGDA